MYSEKDEENCCPLAIFTLFRLSQLSVQLSRAIRTRKPLVHKESRRIKEITLSQVLQFPNYRNQRNVTLFSKTINGFLLNVTDVIYYFKLVG